MAYVERMKRILAVILLGWFFLPLSQCTPAKKAVPVDQAAAPIAEHAPIAEPIVFVPAAFLSSVQEDFTSAAIVVVVFAWPLGFWALRRNANATRGQALTIDMGELLFCALTLGYLSQVFRAFNELRFGGFLVIAALVGHLALSLWTLAQHARTRARRLAQGRQR